MVVVRILSSLLLCLLLVERKIGNKQRVLSGSSLQKHCLLLFPVLAHFSSKMCQEMNIALIIWLEGKQFMFHHLMLINVQNLRGPTWRIWKRNLAMPPTTFLVLAKAFAWRWFHNVYTYSARIVEYWTIYSKKIQQNKKKVWKLGHTFGIVGRLLMNRILWMWLYNLFNLRCKKFWILNNLCHWNPMKISWVTSYTCMNSTCHIRL